MKILQVATLDITIWSFLIPHLKSLREKGFQVEIACKGGNFVKYIEKEGFQVHFIPFNRKLYHFSNIKAFLYLIKLLKDNNYSVVHTHTPIASFISRISARITNVPIIIYTAHGFHFHEHGNMFTNFLYLNLERVAGRFTDVIITINSEDFRNAKKIFPNSQVFYQKGIGINTEKFILSRKKDYCLLKQKLGINYDEKVIGTIAEFNPGKRYDDIIKAAEYILARNQKIKFLLIGDGRLKKYYESLTKKLGIEKKILFIGYTTNVVDYISIMDIFIFPSLREGLPVSVMEAMSMEKPVIGTDIRGNRDLIIDKVTGRIVPIKSPKVIAQHALDLLSDQKLREKMGKLGRERIEKEFSEKMAVNELLRIYQLVERRKN